MTKKNMKSNKKIENKPKKVNNKTKKVNNKGSLFSDNNPTTTVPNTGFKDSKIAQKTIDDMKDRDIIFQFQVINTMYNRALQVLKQSKSLESKKNIASAIALFKKWLNDYKTNKRGDKEKLPYLSVNAINKLEFLAKYYDISHKARGLEKPTLTDKGFLVIYRTVKGTPAKLRNLPVKKSVSDGQTWDKQRNQYIKRRIQMLKKAGYGLIYKDGEHKGLPTILHVNMMMNGYSPMNEKKLLALIPEFKKIIKNKN
jgi:hypothetical protein